MSGVRTCKSCGAEIERSILDENYCICPKCGNYLRYHARKRINNLVDKDTFKEWKWTNSDSNPFNDEKYKSDIVSARLKHNLEESIVCGEALIGGKKTYIGVMDSRFMMASMGHVVGERVAELFKKAIRNKMPVILFCCSGGARMQEGIISLMQMEKTAAMVKKHDEAGLLYVSVLTNPTMGGVTASFATLADIILAEKGAMIGFAGARVIEQNTGEKLPDGFQTAEFQMAHGFVDKVVKREEERDLLAYLLKVHDLKKHRVNKKHYGLIQTNLETIMNRDIDAWEKVKLARCNDRPTSMDYINKLFPDFLELRGDRTETDDHAVIAGIAMCNGCPVTVIGHQKGKASIQDALYRNFGMPSPSGYRKALRLAKQAEKFGRPVIFFVDSIGAACGKEAEEKGQGLAIANLLYEMSALKTPILSVIVGEGGSGGALAFAVGNRVLMLENSIYSVITPEGYASIIWKDSQKAPEAVKKMKLTSDELYKLSIIDGIIEEKSPVTHDNMEEVCAQLNEYLIKFIDVYTRKSKKRLVKERYQRFCQY